MEYVEAHAYVVPVLNMNKIVTYVESKMVDLKDGENPIAVTRDRQRED